MLIHQAGQQFLAYDFGRMAQGRERRSVTDRAPKRDPRKTRRFWSADLPVSVELPAGSLGQGAYTIAGRGQPDSRNDAPGTDLPACHRLRNVAARGFRRPSNRADFWRTRGMDRVAGPCQFLDRAG